MGSRRYRVVLDVQSNMEGNPTQEKEVEVIASYLEGVKGVGEIVVVSCEPVLKLSRPPPSPTWEPEAPTTKSGKKKKR